MEDKRLEKRKEFLNPVKDGRGKREKYMVDLRKKRKQQMFKHKRMIRLEEETKENAEGTCSSNQNGVTYYRKREEFPLYKYKDDLKPVIPVLYEEDVQMVSYKIFFTQLFELKHRNLACLIIFVQIRDRLIKLIFWKILR